MKLKTKTNLLIFSFLALLGIATVFTGYWSISQIIYDLNKQQFTQELNNLDNDITDSYKTLESAGIIDIQQYVENSQHELLKKIQTYQFGQTGSFVIINQHGKVLTQTHQTHFATSKNFQEKINTIQELFATHTKLHPNIDVLLFSVAGTDYFSVYKQSTHWNWLIFFTISKQEIFVKRQEYLLYVGSISLFIFILVFFISVRTSAGFQNEINKILSYLERMSKGNHSLRLPTTRNDELADIEKSINLMMDKIETEILQRISTEKQFKELAFKDSLTNLPNRKLFYDRFELELKRAKRKDNIKLALLFIDLDQFKQVNDTLGHHIGDELLKIVAQRLLGCVREKDTVARLGGDEFTVIITDITSSKVSINIAEKIIKAISVPIKLQDHELFIGASIGISLYPEDSANKEILIRNADAAMYYAKEKGRGNYQFFNEAINQRNQKHRELEEDLRKAIKNEEFELYYQPQIEMCAEKIIGAEVLIRWNHPKKGLILPLDFISIAEENGMIIEIGEWVFKRACRYLHKCLSTSNQPIPLAINLSAIQFSHEGLIDMIEFTLEQEKIPSYLIEFEITESALMENADQAVKIIDNLTNLGIRISIDDFGTGYSSLAYLKKFTVDKLKIDREFIKNLPHDKEDVVLTSTMIMLANNLGLDVLAEGVETKEQADFLLQQGCNIVQGYYYSKPLPEDKFIAYVLSMSEG